MASVLGIDKDTGARVCHGRWEYDVDVEKQTYLFPEGAELPAGKSLLLTDGKASVLAEKEGLPIACVNEFGRGKGIYLTGLPLSNANTRLLLNLMLYGKGLDLKQNYLTDHVDAECAYYPESGKMVIINNSESKLNTSVRTEKGVLQFTLEPFETQIVDV